MVARAERIAHSLSKVITLRHCHSIRMMSMSMNTFIGRCTLLQKEIADFTDKARAAPHSHQFELHLQKRRILSLHSLSKVAKAIIHAESTRLIIETK